MQAPSPAAQPYAWAIEFPSGGKDLLVTFIVNDGRHDLAYVMDYAARLHGVVVPIIADRRSRQEPVS
jgi:hypothetical protein